MFDEPVREPKRSCDRRSVSDGLLAVAERDAAEIVASARVEIARTILKARHELVVLTSQLEAGIELTREPVDQISPGRQAASDARRDLLQVLHEARPDLGALSSAVRMIGFKPPITAAHAGGLGQLRRLSVEFHRGSLSSRSVAVAVAFCGLILTLGIWVGRSTPNGQLETPLSASVRTAGLTGGPTDSGAPRGTSSPPARDDGAADDAVGAAAATGAPRADILRAAEHWLAAYYAKDLTSISVLSVSEVAIEDGRGPDERLPSGLDRIVRMLDEPNVQVFGSEALLTAKMIERPTGGGSRGEVVSFISQMWTRREGGWRLTQARLASAAGLQRAFTR
jgi:hypothetical protein